MFEIPFGRSKYSKPAIYFLPELLSWTRNVLVPEFKMARPQISKQGFLDTLPKNVALNTFSF